MASQLKQQLSATPINSQQLPITPSNSQGKPSNSQGKKRKFEEDKKAPTEEGQPCQHTKVLCPRGYHQWGNDVGEEDEECPDCGESIALGDIAGCYEACTRDNCAFHAATHEDFDEDDSDEQESDEQD